MSDVKPLVVPDILHDDREISAVFDGDSTWCVGGCGVTAIRAYGEPAIYGPVPWFAIYEGDNIIWRIPANGVQYARPLSAPTDKEASDD